MNFNPGAWPGPKRDFVGYGRDVPDARWPGGARVAINIVLNWEEGSEQSYWFGDEANPQGLSESSASTGPGVRDLGAESVYEYGSRAGVWRFARLVDEYRLPTTLFATGLGIVRAPEVAAWARDGNHEVAGHGMRWDRMWEFDRDEERHQIDLATDAIEQAVGVRPAGWYSRYSASLNTRELLVDAGYLYDSDAYNDDLPYYTSVGDRPHLVVPYSLTLNDGRFTTSPGYQSPSDFVDHAVRALDELHREGASRPRMMSIGLHARLIGQPARISALREFIEVALERGVWFTRRIDIAHHWLAEHPPE